MTATAWKKGQVTNPNGRPSTFTEELGERIVDALWSGECKSLIDVEKQDWCPSRRTIHTWKKTYPEFGAALVEAQTALGDVFVHENEEIKRKMLAGEIEPNAASIAIKSNQWVAQAVDNRTYGNKSHIQKDEHVHVTTEYVNRIEIDGLDEEQLDALESALNAKLLTHDGNSTPQ